MCKLWTLVRIGWISEFVTGRHVWFVRIFWIGGGGVLKTLTVFNDFSTFQCYRCFFHLQGLRVTFLGRSALIGFCFLDEAISFSGFVIDLFVKILVQWSSWIIRALMVCFTVFSELWRLFALELDHFPRVVALDFILGITLIFSECPFLEILTVVTCSFWKPCNRGTACLCKSDTLGRADGGGLELMTRCVSNYLLPWWRGN